MKSIRTKWIGGLSILLSIPACWATITPGNSRPMASLPAPSPDALPSGTPGWPSGPDSANLQDILDYIYGCKGCVDAVSDQESTSEWKPTTNPGNINPQLTIELAGNAATTTFGLWSGTDPSNLILVPIFKGSAEGLTGSSGFPSTASLQWNLAGTQLKITGDSSEVFTGIYNVPVSGFGFYIDTGTNKFFSDDELNSGGSPQMMAYLGGNSATSAGAWTLAFEDLPFSSSDKDFNDFVVKIESLAAVPEPASILLLGSVLVAVAGLIRFRMQH